MEKRRRKRYGGEGKGEEEEEQEKGRRRRRYGGSGREESVYKAGLTGKVMVSMGFCPENEISPTSPAVTSVMFGAGGGRKQGINTWYSN